MGEKERNVMFQKSGGHSGKNTTGAKISLPKPWLNEMGVTENNRKVIIEFNNRKIIIRKLEK